MQFLVQIASYLHFSVCILARNLHTSKILQGEKEQKQSNKKTEYKSRTQAIQDAQKMTSHFTDRYTLQKNTKHLALAQST